MRKRVGQIDRSSRVRINSALRKHRFRKDGNNRTIPGFHMEGCCLNQNRLSGINRRDLRYGNPHDVVTSSRLARETNKVKAAEVINIDCTIGGDVVTSLGLSRANRNVLTVSGAQLEKGLQVVVVFLLVEIVLPMETTDRSSVANVGRRHGIAINSFNYQFVGAFRNGNRIFPINDVVGRSSEEKLTQGVASELRGATEA